MKTDDERRLLVLTKYWRDFEQFCRDHDLNPRGRDVKWIKDPDSLRGYGGEWLLILDGGLSRDYIQHLVDVYGFVIVPEPEDPRPRPLPRVELPEVRVRRGGIRFPWGDGA